DRFAGLLQMISESTDQAFVSEKILHTTGGRHRVDDHATAEQKCGYTELHASNSNAPKSASQAMYTLQDIDFVRKFHAQRAMTQGTSTGPAHYLAAEAQHLIWLRHLPAWVIGSAANSQHLPGKMSRGELAF
ncbi:MAG: hypothetical protein Q7U58_06255, partial [Hydrogenophaga sp.]|nr:hypothetical protein [Hydrogenophaga sp.]